MTKQSNKISIEYDIPEDLNAEKGLLSCVLLGAFSEAEELGVSSEWFSDMRHQQIWVACENIIKDGGPLEQVTVSRQSVKNALYIDDLIEHSPSA